MEHKYCKDGGIGAYKDTGTRAFVQTYTHNEVGVKYVDANNEEHKQYIRLRIGTNEGNQIVMLENGKFYMTTGYSTKIYWNQELSIDLIYGAITDIIKIFSTVGNLLNLHTIEKIDLVSAINELERRTSISNRQLVGYIKYLSDIDVEFKVNDLDVRFNNIKKQFEYYSDVCGWVPLPNGWQRLKHLVRYKDELPETSSEAYGVLSEDKVYEYIDDKWTETNVKNDNIGDEYLVEEIYNSQFRGNANGSLINTGMGWTYLVRYNYL